MKESCRVLNNSTLSRGFYNLLIDYQWKGYPSSHCECKGTSKFTVTGLPWWRSGWESACQCRGHGFEPWSGKIPHAAEQLGPWATITEPAHLEPVLRNKRGRDSERPAHHDEEWTPLATTRESPHTETKTQHSRKNKINSQWLIKRIKHKTYREMKIFFKNYYTFILYHSYSLQ